MEAVFDCVFDEAFEGGAKPVCCYFGRAVDEVKEAPMDVPEWLLRVIPIPRIDFNHGKCGNLTAPYISQFFADQLCAGDHVLQLLLRSPAGGLAQTAVGGE